MLLFQVYNVIISVIREIGEFTSITFKECQNTPVIVLHVNLIFLSKWILFSQCMFKKLKIHI